MMKEKKFNIFTYLKKYKKEFTIYILLKCIHAVLTLVIPYYLSQCVNLLYNLSGDINIFVPILKLIFLAIFFFVTSWVVNDLNIRLSNKIAFTLEYHTLEYIKYVKYEIIKDYNDTSLTQRINNDSVVLGDFMVEKLPFFLVDLCLIAIILPILFIINPSIIALLFFMLALLSIFYFAVRKLLYTKNREMLESQENFFGMLSNQIFNILKIKVNSLYTEAGEEFSTHAKEFYKKSISFLRLDFALSNCMEVFKYISYGGCLLILFYQMNSQEIEIGIIPTALIYIQIIFSMIPGLTKFFKEKQKFKVSYDRIYELNNLTKEDNGNKVYESLLTIDVSNLHVEINNKNIFNNINANFKKGEIYIIAGENGSGKTTFINTLLGIISPTEGTIAYNNVDDISSVNMYKCRRTNIAYVEQEPNLHNGSIYENLIHGIDNLKNIEEIKNSKLLDFVSSQKNKWNTMIKTKNVTLSGGEKQKISICRALLKNSDVMIFDEPTSALDSESVSDFILKLEEIRENHIIIIITHDKRIAEIADRTLVFEQKQM